MMRAGLLKQRVGVLRFFFLFLPLFNKHVFFCFLCLPFGPAREWINELEDKQGFEKQVQMRVLVFIIIISSIVFFLCFLNLYKRGFNYRERRNPKLLSLMPAFADWIQGFVI